ncbi:uncharacterized protein LTR77_011266 [Saxophila tyrrhenica]|uniref:Uncharacterized protein n=1 Tax=Saxophila tyrrhenica TaxID=1690608 RepID=A0AAV9NUP7_9PEZI|nr:hypothetical protein LTR77_011266 [Saxophila tyrrhenica]
MAYRMLISKCTECEREYSIQTNVPGRSMTGIIRASENEIKQRNVYVAANTSDSTNGPQNHRNIKSMYLCGTEDAVVIPGREEPRELITHLKMNDYPNSSCHQNTAVACIVCTKTILIMTTSGCKHELLDGCLAPGVYWFRTTTCSRCTKKIESKHEVRTCAGVVGTDVVMSLPSYLNVARYLSKYPRIHTVADMHSVEDLTSIRNSISPKATAMIVVSDQSISLDAFSVADF